MSLSNSDKPSPARPITMALALMLGIVLVPVPGLAQSSDGPGMMEPPRMSMVMPTIDAKRGRRLFVSKGCFICHSVKGVGGKAAPALDANPRSKSIDVVGFIARLWRGAPIMFELQSMELGYRIEFTANEFADLAGFIGDAKAQEGFSLSEIPELVREWKLDEAWWKNPGVEDWRSMLPKEFPHMEGNKSGKP